MKIVIQRVSHAEVSVAGEVKGEIGRGLLLLVGVGRGDSEESAKYLSSKVLNLRVFEDSKGKMNRSVLDIQGGILVVPQFTLYGDCRKGRRPSFDDAASPDLARELFSKLVEELRKSKLTVEEGVFGTHMAVELLNDGPVTLIIVSS